MLTRIISSLAWATTPHMPPTQPTPAQRAAGNARAQRAEAQTLGGKTPHAAAQASQSPTTPTMGSKLQAQPPRPPAGPTRNAWWHHFVGGVVSGFAEGMLFCPADQAILRARLRTGTNPTVWSELFALSDGGARAMYRALSLDLVGTGVRRALFPTVLHTGKGLISDATGLPPENLMVCMAAGTAAGAIDPLFTNPLGRLRTLIQAPINTDKRLNARSAFKAVYESEGFSGLYKGLPTNMTRGATYCTVIAVALQHLDDSLPLPESSVWNAFDGREEWRKVTAHMGAAVCAVTVVSPLDVLLARKQQALGGRQSVFKLGAQLVRQEGVRHFFTGTGFKVAMLAPRQALSLYLAGRLTNRLFGERYEDGDEPS